MLWGVCVCVDLHGCARFSLTPVLRFHEPSDEVETEAGLGSAAGCGWPGRRPPLGHVGVSPSRGPERHAVLAIRHGPDMLEV